MSRPVKLLLDRPRTNQKSTSCTLSVERDLFPDKYDATVLDTADWNLRFEVVLEALLHRLDSADLDGK